MISFGPDICCDFDAATSREWLVTNGIGGYGCGTISGAATRRYHGLLTSALEPPLGRITVLAKYEETLVIDGVRYDLSANRFPGVIHPQGFRLLRSFSAAGAAAAGSADGSELVCAWAKAGQKPVRSTPRRSAR